MLIAARGNPRLLAISDSPVKLVASVIRAWWGRRPWGGEEGYTTLLNNCGASQIENSKVSPEGIRILLCQHGQQEEDILPCCEPCRINR